MQLIVLWDVDHTLIENSGVSKEIYAAAFSAVTGIEPNEPAVTQGRTDRLIMRDMFAAHAVPEPVWEVVEKALARAGRERLDDLRQRGAVLPGVREVLKEASARACWVSSVLTGNIMANAEVKLSAFGLDAYLDLRVGAYGADADLRSYLVDVARERIRRIRGAGAGVPVVLVGDTPRDVEAALAAGCGIVAVSSGVHTAAELGAAGASTVLPDLSNVPAVLHILETFAAR
jgi:phosphoglycolate phosphatase-like HAD superfamily hydrolase